MKPKETGQRAREIYERKLRHELERDAFGKYVVVDVTTERHFVGDTPEEALEKAQEALPEDKRLLHLMRIGHKSVSRFGTVVRHADSGKS